MRDSRTDGNLKNALFVRRLLRKMNRAPGPRSVLILDNARIHHAPELKPMCEEVGVELAYLPRYSPDYNPIEESFSALKAWMRRNRELVDSMQIKQEYRGACTVILLFFFVCGTRSALGTPRLTWGSPDGGERRRPTLTCQNGKGNIGSTWFEFCAPPPQKIRHRQRSDNIMESNVW